MASIDKSKIGLSTRGNAGTGSYLVGKGPMGLPPAVKAVNYPAWHPKNPSNQVNVSSKGN
jgi:hypothetical protein